MAPIRVMYNSTIVYRGDKKVEWQADTERKELRKNE
jgi:hypothetical protein